VGSGWEMVEGGDSIGIGEIGRVLADKRTGRVMVMAAGIGSIVVDCIVEGYIAAVGKQRRLAADLAAVVEEAVGYRNAA
jgi:hypothetical protein